MCSPDISGDRELDVVIFTGTGDSFIDKYGPINKKGKFPAHYDYGAEKLDMKGFYGRTRHMNMLDIQVPIIAAVNGPCSIHSELPVMCDIVLASDDAFFQDSAHVPRGFDPATACTSPGPAPSARTALATSCSPDKSCRPKKAFDYGAVNEVLPRDQLMDRAWELARYLNAAPAIDSSAHPLDPGPGTQARYGQRPFVRAISGAVRNAKLLLVAWR